MTQHQRDLNRLVAKITGETVTEISRRGFVPLTFSPFENEVEDEALDRYRDWDELEAQWVGPSALVAWVLATAGLVAFGHTVERKRLTDNSKKSRKKKCRWSTSHPTKETDSIHREQDVLPGAVAGHMRRMSVPGALPTLARMTKPEYSNSKGGTTWTV